MSSAVMVGLLVAGGVYLVLQRGLLRVTLGFVLLGHAANLLLFSAGVTSERGAPLLGGGDTDGVADPLPQAFVLTAIVITFGITVFLLAMAGSGGDDDGPPAGTEADEEIVADEVAADVAAGHLLGSRPYGAAAGSPAAGHDGTAGPAGTVEAGTGSDR